MNELPAGWQRRKLGEIAKVKYGKGLRASDRVESGTVPVVGSAGRVGMHDEALIDGPAIIIGRKGNAGSTYLETGPSWPIDTTYYLFPPDEVDPQYLALQLDHLSLGQHDSSTAVPSLRRPDLEASVLSLPPLDEQERIVRVTQDLLERLEASVRTLKHALQLVETAEASYTASLLDSAAPQKSVNDLADAIVDCLHSTPSFRDTGLLCLDTNAMSPGTIDRSRLRLVDQETFTRRNRRLVPRAGDVVFAREGSAAIGFAVVIPDDLSVCLGQRVMLIRPSHSVLPEYLESLLNSWVVKSQYGHKIRGSASPHLNVADVKDLRIPVPPVDDQLHFIERSRAFRSLCNRLRHELSTTVRRADSLRSSILAAAFSGRLASQEAVNV